MAESNDAGFQFSDVCEKHNRTIEYYCSDHDEIGCQVCDTIRHKKCDMDYIGDVSIGFRDKHAYKNQVREMNEISKQLDAFNNTVDNMAKGNENLSEEAVGQLRKYKNDIIDHLNRKESEIEIQINTRKMQEKVRLKGLQERNQRVKAEQRDLETRMNSDHLGDSQLFIMSKRSKETFSNLKVEVNELTSDINNRQNVFKFRRNIVTENLLSTESAIGIFHLDISSATFSRAPGIAVKTTDDNGICQITGSAILDTGLLLLADKANKALKLIQPVEGVLLNRMSLSSSPWDTTALPHDDAAVTLPNAKMIQIITTEMDQLQLKRDIHTSGNCYGIAFNADMLAVSYQNPPKLEIMSVLGIVYKCFSTNGRGDQLFKEPDYVAISNNGDSLYVSDWDKNIVIKLSADGNVLRTYMDNSQIWKPAGLTITSDDKLLVCSYGTNNVQVVSKECLKVLDILPMNDKTPCPKTMCYCYGTNTVYVASGDLSAQNRNFLKVYRLNE